MESFKSGYLVGNGAAINVQIGWIPDRVEVYNHTDGNKITTAFLDTWLVPFSGGGTNELVGGETITGVTNTGVTGVISQVLLYSGTWAGGNAAGFFVIKRDDQVGNFGSEDVTGETAGASNDATVTINVIQCYSTDSEVGAETGDTAIAAYVGTLGADSKGFTIGSTVCVEAKALVWSAWRNDR